MDRERDHGDLGPFRQVEPRRSAGRLDVQLRRPERNVQRQAAPQRLDSGTPDHAGNNDVSVGRFDRKAGAQGYAREQVSGTLLRRQGFHPQRDRRTADLEAFGGIGIRAGAPNLDVVPRDHLDLDRPILVHDLDRLREGGKAGDQHGGEERKHGGQAAFILAHAAPEPEPKAAALH